MKSGFVGIVGRPNVGKSTLMNQILGEKIAITTDKPQTTRNSIRGIYTHMPESREDESVQIIFIDTPGIHKAKTKLGSYMTDLALKTFNEVDVLLFLVEGPLSKNPGDRYVLEQLSRSKTPTYLIINKIDKMDPEVFETVYHEYESLGVFKEIHGVSALNGINTDKLTKSLMEAMPEGPMYFPHDMVTDHPERFIVTELIREKILMYLQEEVPHGVAVEIESYEEGANLTDIRAVIYCEKQSHKGIIIGNGGRKLKGIGKSARIEIEALLGTKVFLGLFVKVRENWRDSNFALSSLGYKD